jgi:hypothetical protein
MARTLRRLRKRQLERAFNHLKELFTGNISKLELLKLREQIWLDTREREQAEREAKINDVTHLLLSEGAFQKHYSYNEVVQLNQQTNSSQI